MLSKYKSSFDSFTQSLARRLFWVNPNALTLIGIIPQVLFFILMQSGALLWAAAALAATSLDMLDGTIARANNRVTKFGGFLDSTIDRVSDFIIIAGFYSASIISLNLATILILVSFLISYVRSRAELASNGTIKFDVGFIERPERILFLFLTLILHVLFPNTQILGFALSEFLILILTVLSVFTLFQRILHAYKNL